MDFFKDRYVYKSYWLHESAIKFGYREDATKILPGAAAPGELQATKSNSTLLNFINDDNCSTKAGFKKIK